MRNVMKQRHEPLLETTKGWIFDRKARENYCWEIIQDMIEREVSSAFKLREPTKMPSKKEIKQIIKNTVKKERK